MESLKDIYSMVSEERLLHSNRNRDYEVMRQLVRAHHMDGKCGRRGSFLRAAFGTVDMGPYKPKWER